MIKHVSDCWSEGDRGEVLESVKKYLVLYLFKNALPNIEFAIEKLFKLSPNEINQLKKIHFLLSPELGELIKVLPQLTRNLAHSSLKQTIETRGIIRGKVDWAATYKRRYAYGYDDKSLFISSPSSKSYDLEENQLLKFILNKVISFSNEIDFESFSESCFKNWTEIIAFNVFNVKNTLKNVYFNEISSPKHIKPKSYRKAINHRNRHYPKVGELYKLYEDLFLLDDRDRLLSLIQKQILEPMENDNLYELYIFFNLVNYLSSNLDDFDFGLLIPANDYAVGYNDLKIYYQNVPQEFRENTRYKEIIENYDMQVTVKRPDIIIEFIDKGEFRFVEVKRSSNSSYIAGSVYKAMGYLADFSKVNFTDNYPAVLVVWDGINFTDFDKALDEKVLILNKSNYLKNRDLILGL